MTLMRAGKCVRLKLRPVSTSPGVVASSWPECHIAAKTTKTRCDGHKKIKENALHVKQLRDGFAAMCFWGSLKCGEMCVEMGTYAESSNLAEDVVDDGNVVVLDVILAEEGHQLASGRRGWRSVEI